jgi:hypothetical protein
MAPPAPRECNQPAQRIASQTIRAPCSAAQRIGPRIASRASHALHRILCSAALKTLFLAHRKQSAHRKPARYASPAAPAAHRPPHGAHLAPAALHALRSTLRWFRLVRGTNFSKIQFMGVCLLDR